MVASMIDADQQLHTVFDEVSRFERGQRDDETSAEIDQSERTDNAVRTRGETD